MSPRGLRAGIGTSVLITGNAEDVVQTLIDGARRNGVEVVDASAPPDGARAGAAIAAVRTRSHSTLALGIRTLDEVEHLLQPGALRLVIAVRPKLPITPSRLMGPLLRELLFQASVGTGDAAEGARKQRRARARLGSAILDAAGLHVFRVGPMRGEPTPPDPATPA